MIWPLPAASIDGATHFQMFTRIVLPLSVPALAAFAIFQFLWTWNDYLIAITMIGANPDALPATIKIAALAGEFGEHAVGGHALIRVLVTGEEVVILLRAVLHLGEADRIGHRAHPFLRCPAQRIRRCRGL